jgi:hypothetical protein
VHRVIIIIGIGIALGLHALGVRLSNTSRGRGPWGSRSCSAPQAYSCSPLSTVR